MTSQAEELKKFPPRILQTLKDMADRRSIGNRGSWEYGDGTGPAGVVSSNQLGNCPCEPMLMFDRYGNPRTRYMRISHDGAHMVMTPEEAQCFKEESEISGDETPYILTDTYLSESEFENLPEFEGF